jgi:hypothetical protein
MNSLMTQGGLKEKELVTKLICFGVDGVSTFQGLKFGVIVQIQHQYSPFVIGVRCIVHWINLVVQTFSNLLLVFELKVFCGLSMLISTTTLRNTWNLTN